MESRSPLRSSRKWSCVILIAILVSASCMATGYFSGFFYETGLLPCSPPPGLMVDGETAATVLTWEDLNGNGTWDSGEPPLSGVTAKLSFASRMPSSGTPTGEAGQIHLAEFRAGCACKCWEGEFVAVDVPAGYRATTPTMVELVGPNLEYSFGFQLIEDPDA